VGKKIFGGRSTLNYPGRCVAQNHFSCNVSEGGENIPEAFFRTDLCGLKNKEGREVIHQRGKHIISQGEIVGVDQDRNV